MQFSPAGNFNLPIYFYTKCFTTLVKSKYQPLFPLQSYQLPHPIHHPIHHPISHQLHHIQYLNKFYNCYWILKNLNHTIYFIVIARKVFKDTLIQSNNRNIKHGSLTSNDRELFIQHATNTKIIEDIRDIINLQPSQKCLVLRQKCSKKVY
jgi:hypothetical protein